MKPYSLQKIVLLSLLLGSLAINVNAKADDAGTVNKDPYPNLPYYIGVGAGYGDTDWDQLIPTGPNDIPRIATPDSAISGGLTTTEYLGVHLIRNFSVELRAAQYPDATINFKHVHLSGVIINGHTIVAPGSPLDIAIPNPYGLFEFESKTSDYQLVGNFIVPMSVRLHIDGFIELGVNYTYRQDVVSTKGYWGPMFGGGVSYRFSPRFGTVFDFQYVPGTAAASEGPAFQYMPYLYAVNLKLQYYFDL